jgi:hypothetical protein
LEDVNERGWLSISGAQLSPPNIEHEKNENTVVNTIVMSPVHRHSQAFFETKDRKKGSCAKKPNPTRDEEKKD